MESTTLKVRLGGRDIYLACRRRECFCLGSAEDCKLSIDGEGIAPEHCEIERGDGFSFVVRSVEGETLTVTGVDPLFPDVAPRRVLLGRGYADEAEVESPFVLEIGFFELEASLVEDSEAEGFEELGRNQDDDSPPNLVIYQKRKKKFSEAGLQHSVLSPALPPGDSLPEELRMQPPPETTVLPNVCSASSRSLTRRAGAVAFACAIPALRFGFPAAMATRPGAVGEATVWPDSGVKLISLSRHHEKRAAHTNVTHLSEVPSGLFLFAVILIGLFAASGYGWFEWRKFTLPKNPALLRAKIAKGDTFAMATLGLSLIRGEWGVELNTTEGIGLIEDSASTGDPFGLLALGYVQSEGYQTSTGENIEGEHSRGVSAWSHAFQSGLEDRLGEVSDSRWWTLAGCAGLAVPGQDAEKSRGWLLRADRRRYPEAAATLASYSSNEADSAEWLRRTEENSRVAARLGSVFARRILGELHRSESFAEGDPYFGADEIERAADAGEPKAQLLWAELLDERGDGKAAFQWFERAAEAGFLPAKVEVARRYLTGLGVSAQPHRALLLAEEAGAAGEVAAFRVLAKAHAEGIGVDQDTERAIRLLTEPSDRGDIGATADLGRILADSGRGNEAVAPLRRAAEAGDLDSAIELGRILSMVVGDASHAEAVIWLEKALAGGRAEAAIHLAEALDHPDRSHRDPSRVVLLLESLADGGDHLCGLRLSRYLLEGRGCELNPTKAFLLVKKAADAGEKSAFFPLGELYENGAGNIAPSPAAALVAYRKAIDSSDERVFQRFPGLLDAPAVVASFMKSWESVNHNDTILFLADSVDSYFHLEKPDAARIASLESGFRQLWKRREVKTGSAETISLEALDHIRLEIPFEFTLAREKWKVGGNGRAKVDLRLMAGGEWRIFRFTENIKEWGFDPGRPSFDVGQDSVANSRGVFPALTPDEATYDITNFPLGLVDQVKAAPFADKFSRRLALLPTSIGEDVIIFSRLNTGGEVILPVSHFDADVIERIESLSDLQSFTFYEELFNQLLQEPNRADPAAAALLESAKGGDHEAAAILGEHFYDGLGSFPVNRVEALKWFVQSARAQNPLGRLWIAVMTDRGEISASSPVKDLYRNVLPDLAPIIARSEAKAPYWRATGECFAGGEEVSLAERQPRELLERASQRGDLRAKLLLGETFLESNPIEGIRYLRNASDGGCATASTRLASYYLGPGNDARLVPDLLRAAARKNDIEAQILLGLHLAPTEPAESAFWLNLGLHHSIQFAVKDLEVRARRAVRELKPTVGEDHFRRAANFLAKKKKSLR